MHYVNHGTKPEKLKEYHSQFTQKWVDHYLKGRGGKPVDAHWTKDEIREPLIECFEDNCGYCGTSMGKRPSKSGKMIPIGQVDHFLPKSKCPEFVYYWENYIWSCTDCNKAKGDFYEQEMILYPGCKKDMEALELRNNGKYYLKMEFAKNELLQKRYRATCEKTIMNFGIHPNERKAIKDELEYRLSGIITYGDMIRSDVFNKADSKIQSFIKDKYQKTRSNIKQILNSSHYKKMIQSIINKSCKKNQSYLLF
ncbi:MAG: hypothetical protein OMM_04283 [Candidatus Magnetoglobus multicellularis str. Araruama]|uniref:HNH domain-containing protein n=1 Tax=Candidatus Magnetoglobus multicellularis str. Araruama TaxID=890399 RepID=A0A1V1P1Z8_9BACT|nr:MAG: hypothetical protein OMM_04283 [Candidatus Magnetoglobus multicellularis str. Araruama]